MNVLHIYKTYRPDNFTGIPRVIDQIAEGLSGCGVHTSVLALSDNPCPDALKIGSHWVHQAKTDFEISSTSISLSAFSMFRELAREADILHYHFPWPISDVMHLVYGRGKPSIVTYHSDVVKQRYIRPIYTPLMHLFLDSVDQIVATSPNYLNSSPVLQHYLPKTSIIPIGIDKRQLPATSELDKWRSRVGEDFFLFVGSLRYYKGLDFLMEAARITGFPVLLAGKGKPPTAAAELANVKVLGEVSDADKEALLELSRAFVFPSHLRSEAFGIALLEAARAGKPMISCNIGTGTTYVNLGGETGLTIAPADSHALAHAMQELVADAANAKSMGENARHRFEKCFTSEAMCKSYLEKYLTLQKARLPE